MKPALLAGVLGFFAFHSGAAIGAPGVTLSGFLDARYQWSPEAGDTRGPGLGDSALYADGEFGPVETKADLPFQFNTRDTGTDQFRFAKEKAQAYVGYLSEGGFHAKVGQWDTLYGVEANDSADRRFSQLGIVASQLNSFTEMGMMAGFETGSGLGFSGYVAFAKDFELFEEGSPEVGVQLTLKQEKTRASLGYRLQRDYAVGENNAQVNAVFGVTVGRLSVDLEMDAVYPAGNPFAASGFGLHLAYELNNVANLATRLEYIASGVKNEVQQKDQYAITVGPEFKLGESVKVRAEYQYERATALGEAARDFHSGALAAVYQM